MPNRSLIQAFLDHRNTDPRIRTEVHQDPMRSEVVIRMSTVMQSEIRVSQRELMGSREHALRFVDHGLEAFRRRIEGEDRADIQDIARMRHEQELERLRSVPESYSWTREYLGESFSTFQGVNRTVDERLQGIRIPASGVSVQRAISRLTGKLKPQPEPAVSFWEHLDHEWPEPEPTQTNGEASGLYWAAVAEDWELVA
jgi:hypothetical protein